jgi:hypothetical protein
MGKRPAEVESFVGHMGSTQWEDTAFYAKRRTASHGNGTRTNSSEVVATKAVSPIPGAASYRYAVNRLLTSVVREICTLRSVGAGGG